MKKIIKIILIIVTMIIIALGLGIILEPPSSEKGCYSLYEQGLPEEALDVCSADARNGDAIAKYTLGNLYKEGYGVQRDYSKAKSWYEKAANQDHKWAQYELANLYMQGLGVKQDYIQARIWYEVSASLGNGDPAIFAKEEIAYMDKNDLGIQIDLNKAILWYRAACDNLHHEGCEKVNQLSLPE